MITVLAFKRVFDLTYIGKGKSLKGLSNIIFSNGVRIFAN